MGIEILLGDDLRHRPGREEIDLDDLGRDLRRRPRGLAGDDVALEREIAVLDGLRDEGRHVDEHVARRLVDAHQPLDAGEVALQLPQTVGRSCPENGERARIDEAGDAKPVPHLEARKAREELIVEDRARAGVRKADRPRSSSGA